MNKKRVLYFVPEFPRLTETFIEREISQLVKFGVLDITVVSLNRASGYLSPRVEGVVHFHKLNLKHCLMSLRFLVLRPMQVLRAYALVFKASPTMIFRNTYLIAKAIGFASLFAEFKPDHIHAHFLSDPSTICMVVADLLGVPFSISGHARDVFVDGTFIPQKVVRAKFLSICNTYAWSKAVQLSGGMNSSNIHKIYHGMDLTFYLSSEPKMKKPDRPMIFAGSRLVEKKGLNYLIDASKILKDRGINHEVHIVGPGELYSKLVEQVHILGLENNVFIPGEGQGVSNAEIMEYFKVADIFAHPSVETGKGDVDGVPTFVIEACMARVPVVTTEAGSITDLIDETSGVLVPQRDSKALADGLEFLIYNPDKRKSFGEVAYKKASVMFNLEKNIKALQDLFVAESDIRI